MADDATDSTIEDFDDDIIDDEDEIDIEEEEQEEQEEAYNVEENNIKIIKVIHPNNRRLSNYMSLFEEAKVIGARAEMINKLGERYYCEEKNKFLGPKEKAILELLQNKCPLIIRRPVYTTDKYYIVEEWSCNELIKRPELII